MNTFRIHLIRNGLTRANIEGIYCGTTDLSLCEQGRSELHALVEEYSYPYTDILYVSPLARARETAGILFPDCEQEIVEDLRECSFGIYEGRSFAELGEDASFQEWVVFGSDRHPAGAESPLHFQKRCVNAFVDIVHALMKNGNRSCAIVTHAGVIANILSSLGYPKKTAYDWQCIPGCGYTVRVDPSLFLRDPVIEIIGYVPEDLDV